MLTSEQARQNQEKYGFNELVEGKKKSTLQIFLEQYKDFLVIILIIAAIVSGLVIILIIAAIVSGFLGDFESAIVILVVITMNAILGTVQTLKAEQSLDALKQMSAPEAKVIRDGGSYDWRPCAAGGRRLCAGRWKTDRVRQSEGG